ncbi:hypothetical protein [Campylobacter devanensis]|uniref:hypothetical protein n=1 Tax=Campylobacter devanensis TaxID=3161138 RepID=UPI0015D900BD|nr:hypothetical protein [Campylobacter sp. P0139]
MVSGADLDPRDGDEPSVELVWELDRVIWLTEFGRLFDELVFANGLDGFAKSNLFNIGVFRELRVKLSSIIGKEYGALLEEQDMKIKDIKSKNGKFLICGL